MGIFGLKEELLKIMKTLSWMHLLDMLMFMESGS